MDEQALSLPFLTRKMLAFENAQRFAIKITTQSNAVGVVTITGATREGLFTFSQPTTDDAVVQTTTFAIPDFPLFLSVNDVGELFAQGGCRATVTLLINDDPMYMLCSGLVYNRKGISYPQTADNDLRPGGGEVVTVGGTDPAAGSEISDTFSGFYITKIIAIRFTLVTDANAANRRVHVKLAQTFQEDYDFFGDQDQAASLTRRYTVAAHTAPLDYIDDNDILIPIPADLLVRPGTKIQTETTNKQAGDNFSGMQYLVERWFA